MEREATECHSSKRTVSTLVHAALRLSSSKAVPPRPPALPPEGTRCRGCLGPSVLPCFRLYHNLCFTHGDTRLTWEWIWVLLVDWCQHTGASGDLTGSTQAWKGTGQRDLSWLRQPVLALTGLPGKGSPSFR